ncbi:MAG: DNA translocase FtsK 4TM domain-containing protein, partial [Patescibacteria group bacterium]
MARHSRKRSYRSSQRFSQSAPAALFHSLSPEARQGISVVVVLMLALLSALSLVGLAGAVGESLDRFFSSLFGNTKFAVPVFIIIGGIFFIRRVSLSSHVTQVIGLLFFMLSFAAFWHLQYPVEESFARARDGMGGGMFGFFLAYSLQSILQFWGALIVLLSIFLISFFILLNSSLGDVIGRLKMIGSVLLAVGMFFVSFFGRFFMPTPPRSNRRVEEGKEDVPEVPTFSRGTLPASVRGKDVDDDDGEDETEKAPAAKEEIEILKAPKRKTLIQIPLDLLQSSKGQPTSGDIKTNKIVIQRTLENFGIPVEMGEVNVGPTVTQYTLKPAEGIKLATIIGLHNDLALALAAHPIRIEAPIPGKALVGIEVPNQRVATVTLRELLESEQFKKRANSLSLALGKDVSGMPRVASLLSMPHLLIAGSTGSGKTVCINTIITTLLYQNSPETLRLVLVDPKRVELTCYNDIPHLLTPVVTDVKKTLNALRWAIGEMERRFDILSKAGKRDLKSYNEWAEEKMPYVVMV